MEIVSIGRPDVRLTARVRGEGRTILLLHGFPDTHETWAGDAVPEGVVAVEDRLVATGFRTVALALRGYAPSGIPSSGDYSLRALADDVVAVLDHLGVDQGLLVGHDWGASAAYTAAALHSERIERMATLAIPPFPVLPSGLRERLARPHNLYLAQGATSAWLLQRDGAVLVERLYRRWSPEGIFRTEHIERVRDALSDPRRARASVAYYGMRLTEADRHVIVRPITVPTLAIYGEDEPASRREAFAHAAPYLGEGSRIVPIAGVGHWPHLEAADQVGELVAEWVSR